ncbi:MAG: ABC transporter ATP-binding protein [Bacteroidota bacterium]
MSLLQTKSLSIGFPRKNGDIMLQSDINLTIEKGETVSLMGQNGVGKTTFIKTLAGLLTPLSGSIYYNQKILSEISSMELAQKMSLVLTEKPFNFNITPVELIAIARHPYSNWIGMLSNADKDAIEWAVSETNINYIANKKLYELSDGQLQKVMIARALAQETDLIILDEPAAHLDLNNKIEVMLLLRKIAAKGKGILISTHDLQVSTQLSDKLMLFNFNDKIQEGVPEDLILNKTLQKGLYLEGYGYDMIHGTLNLEQEGPSINLSGDADTKFWVSMALKRKGFKVLEKGGETMVNCKAFDEIEVLSKGNKQIVKSISELLGYL